MANHQVYAVAYRVVLVNWLATRANFGFANHIVTIYGNGLVVSIKDFRHVVN